MSRHNVLVVDDEEAGFGADAAVEVLLSPEAAFL